MTNLSLKNLSDSIKQKFYPEGVPSNFRARLGRDYETGNVVVLNVTDKPELWHLPIIDAESFNNYAQKIKEENQ